MAVYENVNGVIRQVNNIYENINGVIRQVNARYQNVNGVIRQTYGNNSITYNGGWTIYNESNGSYYTKNYSSQLTTLFKTYKYVKLIVPAQTFTTTKYGGQTTTKTLTVRVVVGHTSQTSYSLIADTNSVSINVVVNGGKTMTIPQNYDAGWRSISYTSTNNIDISIFETNKYDSNYSYENIKLILEFKN